MWSQSGSTLKLSTSRIDVYAIMPDGWRLDACHPSALAVAEWMLLHKVCPDECLTYDELVGLEPRPRGSSRLLSFSGGADSLAALRLLPTPTVPIYMKRPYSLYPKNDRLVRIGSQVAAERVAAEHDSVVFESTFEYLGLPWGLKHGLHDGWGYGAILALYADFFGAGIAAFGGILDTVWMGFGTTAPGDTSIWQDVTAHPRGTYMTTKRVMGIAGLDISLPVAGCSEAVTVRIAPDGISCPIPSDDGTPCGTCLKCFRKEQLMGRPVTEPTASVRKAIAKRPLKMATSVIEGCRVCGHFPPELAEFSGVDTSWTQRHWDDSLDMLCPPGDAAVVRERLAHYGIEAMSEADVAEMKAFLNRG